MNWTKDLTTQSGQICYHGNDRASITGCGRCWNEYKIWQLWIKFKEQPLKMMLCLARMTFLGFRAMFDINLGDVVIWNGTRCVVANGVSRPIWDIYQIEPCPITGAKRHFVNESDFKKEVSIKNYTQSFKSMWSFYETSWLDIWLKLEPWYFIPNWTIRNWMNRIGNEHKSGARSAGRTNKKQ